MGRNRETGGKLFRTFKICGLRQCVRRFTRKFWNILSEADLTLPSIRCGAPIYNTASLPSGSFRPPRFPQTSETRQVWVQIKVKVIMSVLCVVKCSVVLVLCVSSVFHLVSAHHPCGENPLRRLVPLTRILNEVLPDSNRDINSILNLLRLSHQELYRQIEDEWRSYASCVGLVDTGYFKRSNLGAAEENLSQMTSGLDQNTGMSSGVREEMNLLMDILQGAIFDETDGLGVEQASDEQN
ncbi:hypothetical protein RRG08_045012 [Elysia crispata]|uniref:Uncharacterized protein n=1 Tax=Elysia crispata TaxID=231223 RepID=A0AAE0Y3V9_9GAST|nr:hypothetical protein RRG08_045012 [Elysia crispata]